MAYSLHIWLETFNIYSIEAGRGNLSGYRRNRLKLVYFNQHFVSNCVPKFSFSLIFYVFKHGYKIMINLDELRCSKSWSFTRMEME